MQSEALAVMARVGQALDLLGIAYLVGGSMASATYGIYRPTQDVDIVAALRLEHVAPLVAELEDEFYIDAEMIRAAIQNQSTFNLIYLRTMDKVDVFILESIPWAREELRRRRSAEVEIGSGAATIWFASPEDLVLQKLRRYRMGGETSERQWNDVLGVLKVQRHGLDLPYMDHWAEELGVSDLLGRILVEAGWA
jgi:hypothetical protein